MIQRIKIYNFVLLCAAATRASDEYRLQEKLLELKQFSATHGILIEIAALNAKIILQRYNFDRNKIWKLQIKVNDSEMDSCQDLRRRNWKQHYKSQEKKRKF